MKKAQDQHLTKDQCTEVERALDSETHIVLHLGITTENIGLLIRQNPFLAVAYLVKLSNYPVLEDYLEVIKDGEVSMNSIDVILRITKLIRMPRGFIVEYTQRIMQKVMEGGQKNVDRPKLARLIINFIKNLKKNKLLSCEQIQERS